MQESLFDKVIGTHSCKKGSCTGVFLWVLPIILEHFFENYHWVTSDKYDLFITSTLATKYHLTFAIFWWLL